MASLVLASSTCTPNSFSSSSSYSDSLFANKSSKILITRKNYHIFNFSCKATNGGAENPRRHISQKGQNSQTALKIDRRNVLLGLGGLYGTAANLEGSAIALPVPGPDITTCGDATPDNGVHTVQYSCCPPATSIEDYKIPTMSITKVRPAAHLVSEKYKAKFSEAIKLMKKLPKADPRNFYNQAEIHCAYCNGAYKQLGYPDKVLQVHFSWLFLPFHRWYLYFFERILGKLIGDPNFAIPFWNWDNPSGMRMPPLYLDSNFSMFDCNRNSDHLNKLVDLNYNGTENHEPDFVRIINNLTVVHKAMYDNSHTGYGVFGGEIRGGEDPISEGGSIESPHNLVHQWVGDPTQPYNENMGNFYSAAKDPIFYGHHGNVDRLWSIWKELDNKNTDPTDDDWRNSSFLFYDENNKLVRVYVKDCVNTKTLGYTYEEADTLWKDAKPTPRLKKSTKVGSMFAAGTTTAAVVFPVTLDKEVKVLVQRPKKSRTKEEKENTPEVLVLEGIEYSMEKFVKFDVYIKDEDENGHAAPSNTEYLGSFTSLPHRGKHAMKGMAKLVLGLTAALEGLEADNDDTVVVTLVPRAGSEDVKVGSINIKFASRK